MVKQGETCLVDLPEAEMPVEVGIQPSPKAMKKRSEKKAHGPSCERENGQGGGVNHGTHPYWKEI